MPPDEQRHASGLQRGDETRGAQRKNEQIRWC
jgi:hypothetical protein